jgi:hypothetical protein
VAKARWESQALAGQSGCRHKRHGSGDWSTRVGLNAVARPSRKFWVGMTAGCAVAAWVLIGGVVMSHAGAFSLVLGILALAGCVASLRTAIRLPVRFSIDQHGLVVGAGKRFVPWDEVDEIRIAHHQTAYEEEHNLILKLKPRTGMRRKFITTNATNPSEVEVGLDHISLPWQQVVSEVEAASGMKVHAVREGVFRLRSQPAGRD